MSRTLDGRRVAILAADGVERVELEEELQALSVTLAPPSSDCSPCATPWAAGQAATRATSGCRRPTKEPSPSPTASRTNAPCSRRTPPPPAGRDEVRTEHLATHVMSLEEGPKGYQMFKEKEDGCVRAVFVPAA